MNYQVWTKDEYEEKWSKVDCGDLPAARREVDKAVRAGQEPLLTIEIPYELSIKVGEPGSEAPKPKKKGTISVEELKEETKVEATES